MKPLVLAAFERFPHADFLNAAGTCARYRLTSLDITRRADRDSHRMFLYDLGEIGRRSSPEMQLIAHLMVRPAPQIMKSRADAKDPMFEEHVIPERIRNFSSDLFPLSASLNPSHLIANYASRELARGKCQTPSYTPYISTDVSSSTWPASSDEHAAAMAKRTSNKKALKPGAQPPPFTPGIRIACALSLPRTFALPGFPSAACPPS